MKNIKPPMRSNAPTLLYVEDDHSVRAATVGLLNDEGYRVIEAQDRGTGRLALLSSKDIALVISDMGYGGGGIGAFAVDLRKERPDLKIIVTPGDAYAWAALRQGNRDIIDDQIAAVLPKPFASDLLLRSVWDAIANPNLILPATTPAFALRF